MMRAPATPACAQPGPAAANAVAVCAGYGEQARGVGGRRGLCPDHRGLGRRAADRGVQRGPWHTGAKRHPRAMAHGRQAAR
ncbi:hypothetical protein [Dactylosporangium darangshiense]|uniref:Uncharacterized protein n=1 Tax=Dactylosporangium darangshiense TaxID=579108 RepID=A0ABP8DR56_9ACTN